MNWLKRNARDIWTVFLCLVVIASIIAVIGLWGYCGITFGGKSILETPSICFMLGK